VWGIVLPSKQVQRMSLTYFPELTVLEKYGLNCFCSSNGTPHQSSDHEWALRINAAPIPAVFGTDTLTQTSFISERCEF
jgi:hypothetical protein